jgi:hypothetical protein
MHQYTAYTTLLLVISQTLFNCANTVSLKLVHFIILIVAIEFFKKQFYSDRGQQQFGEQQHNELGNVAFHIVLTLSLYIPVFCWEVSKLYKQTLRKC